jgi:hypothetical protein
VSDSVFSSDGEHYVPSVHARGPWDPQALHGGAPAALIATMFERVPCAPALRVARLGFELLRPIPFAPLSVTTRVVRDGRRVQELAGELAAGDEPICRARALRIHEVPAQVAPGGTAHDAAGRIPGPEDGRDFAFSLDAGADAGFATAMDMRWLSDPQALGPGLVWMHLRRPLLDGAPASPLANVAASADFGNGVSAELPWADYVFINADLSIHLYREPVGLWTGLDARTLLAPGGVGTAECVLHDAHGPLGRSFQSLVVGPRTD